MSTGDAVHEAPTGESSNSDGASRRYFLIQATSVVGAAGAVGAAWPFISYWSPSEKAKALGAPVKIDVSKLAPGQVLTKKGPKNSVSLRQPATRKIREGHFILLMKKVSRFGSFDAAAA